MLRKVIAVVTLVIGLVAGSVLVASARTGVDPQANLRQGQNVLPGTGRAFEIQVSNGVLEPVDWVSITLPASAGITPSSQPVSAPDGWTATVINPAT